MHAGGSRAGPARRLHRKKRHGNLWRGIGTGERRRRPQVEGEGEPSAPETSVPSPRTCMGRGEGPDADRPSDPPSWRIGSWRFNLQDQSTATSATDDPTMPLTVLLRSPPHPALAADTNRSPRRPSSSYTLPNGTRRSTPIAPLRPASDRRRRLPVGRRMSAPAHGSRTVSSHVFRGTKNVPI